MEQKSKLTILETILFLIAIVFFQSILCSTIFLIYGIVYALFNPGFALVDLISVLGSSAVLNIINLLIIEITFFTFALILGRKYGTSFISLFEKEKINSMLVVFIILFSISYMIVASELENIFASLFVRMTFIGEFIMDISKVSGIVGLIVSIFFIGFVPAVAEETLFRGVIQKNLSLRYGVLKGLIITSFLFALIHVNPSSIVSIFLLGLMLGYLYLKTGNLIYPIMLHFFYNTSTNLILRFSRFEISGLNTGLKTIEHVPLTIFLSAVIFSILLVLATYKTIESRENEQLVNDVISSDF